LVAISGVSVKTSKSGKTVSLSGVRKIVCRES
jgi:hypothetical protein